MRPWLQDPDGDGTYTFTTSLIPPGSWEVKVAHGLSWDENYGRYGVRDGENHELHLLSDTAVTVRFDYATKDITTS